MRHLTPSEIQRLEANGCRCRDWNAVTLRAEKFDADNYADVWFAGAVTLGAHSYGEAPRISRVYLKDCDLGDEVAIRNVHEISGYSLGHGVSIEDCGTIRGEGGHPAGIEVNVLDETGSVCVRIYPGLTAQIAKMAIDDPEFRQALDHLVLQDEAAAVRPRIGDGASLLGAANIARSYIGERTRIGYHVIIEDSVIESDSVIDKCTQICRCFVGQGVTLSNFTAQHSLFFANSHLCNGEAASVFAGPFSVSEHKSTLLIGAEIMMYNAGSGTNQSNHLYKLGPIHYGSMGRGCKCASDSYIMWPAKIGEFTMVSGRHYCHPDTRLFPFSYLIAGDHDGSILLPAENMAKCGTARDISKWPGRDKRSADRRLDIIEFDALNPASVMQMERAIALIDKLLTDATDAETVRYLGMKIPLRALSKGRALYANALMRYYGEKYLEAAEAGDSPTELNAGDDEWTDIAGYVLPDRIVGRIKEALKKGEIDSVASLARAIADTFPEKRSAERAFALSRPLPAVCAEFYSIPRGASARLIALAGLRAQDEYLTLVLADGAKEAKMAGRPTLATDDRTLSALRIRLSDLKKRVAEMG